MSGTIAAVLPCYNAHRDLPRALDSLRTQTRPPDEIIVIDDGSTDPATLAFLDALPADVRLVRQANRGLAGARNSGFRAARSDLVLPLDCDDAVAPAFLERAAAALRAHPDKAFAFSWLDLVGERTGVLRKNYNFFEQLFLNQLPYCILVRKSAWEAVGGYDETFREGYEDWEFNIALGARGLHGICLQEALFRYHVSAGGMLGSLSRPRHGRLWRRIQTKHAALYRPRGLFRLWRRWRGVPSTYPLWLYFGWLLLHRLLPNRLFAAIFQRLMSLSHSHRASAQNG